MLTFTFTQYVTLYVNQKIDGGNLEMKIIDYSSATNLNDVKIVLTRSEAEELALYLDALLRRPELRGIHLTEVGSCSFDKDIRFELSTDLSAGAA